MDSSRTPLVIGAIALAAVAFVGGLVLIGRATQDDGDGASSSCIVDLLAHLPDGVTSIDGGDLALAREGGYADGSVDELVQSSIETGVRPDPVTTRLLSRAMIDQVERSHDSADVECWVGSLSGDEWVARGDFDADRVAGSDLADAVTISDDGELIGSEAAMLEPREAPTESAVAALDALGAEVASFSLLSRDEGASWVGLGLARGSGRWELALSWSFADEAAAADAEGRVQDLLGAESRTPELVTGDLAGSLTLDGTTLSARRPIAGAASDWLRPLQMFDPILGPLDG